MVRILKKYGKSITAFMMVFVIVLGLTNGLVLETEASTLNNLEGYFTIQIKKNGNASSSIRINTKSSTKDTDGESYPMWGTSSSIGPKTTFTIAGSSNNKDNFSITTRTTRNQYSANANEGNLNIMMMPFSYKIPKHYAVVYKAPTNGSGHLASWEYWDSSIQYSYIQNTLSNNGKHHATDTQSTGNYAAVNVSNAGMNAKSGEYYHATMYIDLWKCYGGLKVNPNGGTWNNSTATQSFVGQCETTKQIANPTKSNYEFRSWSLSKGANSNGSISGTTFTFCGNQPPSRDTSDANQNKVIAPTTSTLWESAYTTLTAQWGYTVKYDGNGATNNTVKSQSYTIGNTNQIPADYFENNNGWYKAGYTLIGYDENPDATIPKYTTNSRDLTDIDKKGNTTLYAIWAKKPNDPANANVLKNIEKKLKVNIIKVDSKDNTKTLDAKFSVYEWSAELNNGFGAYKTNVLTTINSNTTYDLNYTKDNQGKFKVVETWVESPYDKNSGHTMEINMKSNECKDYFYNNNTLVKEDRGAYSLYYPYEKGDIVKYSDGFYYRAKVANYGKVPTMSQYWERLTTANYPQYDALVTGSGEFSTRYLYGVVYATELPNDELKYSEAYFSLEKTDESGSLLNGAHFTAYYVDENGNKDGVAQDLNEQTNYSKGTGNYGILYNKDGKRDEDRGIKIDETQSHATLSADGKTKTLQLLVTEDKVPEGKQKIDDFRVTVTAEFSQNEWKVTKIQSVYTGGQMESGTNGMVLKSKKLVDESYRFDIKIVKKGTRGYYPTEELAGTVFGVYRDETCEDLVTTITIRKDGKGTLKDIPVGDYWVKEIEPPTSGLFELSDEVQKINAPKTPFEQKPTVTLTFKDDEKTGTVRVHKVDDKGNELDGAVFMLYEATKDSTEDNFKIASGSSTFTPYVSSPVTVKDGYAVFTNIPFGKYVICETVVPEGFEQAPDQLVELKYEEGIPAEVYAEVVNNPKPKRIKIHKVDSSGKNNLEGAGFVIQDSAKNGAYLTPSNEWSGDIDDALIYTTDKDGLILIEDREKIFEKTDSYVVTEITPPEGCYLPENEKDRNVSLDLSAKPTGTDKDGVDYWEITIKNNYTEIPFEKKDLGTNENIAGGHFAITIGSEYEEIADEETDEIIKPDNIIEEWDNDGTPHIVKGLVVGENYYFNEVTAPDGYTSAPAVEFTVDENGMAVIEESEQDSVVMYDDYNKLEVIKADIETKEPLAGAHLELHIGDSADGEIYKYENGEAKWISTLEPRLFERIPAGTYTLVETQAPKGYTVAESITFDVGDTSEVQEITMYDDFTKTQFIKLATDTGKPLEGVKLQVLDKNKKLVAGADWITDGTPHEIDYLIAGETYYLHEVSAPSDYQLAEDVEFVAGEPFTDTSVFEEIGDYVTPNGVEGREEMEPEENPDEDTFITLKGWKFQILDEDGKAVTNWTSDGNTHTVNGLTEGEVYYIHVQEGVEGYSLPEGDIEFKAVSGYSDNYGIIRVGMTVTVPEEPETDEDGEIVEPDQEDGATEEEDVAGQEEGTDFDISDVVTVYMVDKPKLITVHKFSDYGEDVYGAQLQIIDNATDEIMYTWITSPEVATVFKLKNGQYRIHEVYAPDNFELAEDINFIVDDNTTEVEYTMIDKLLKGSIRIMKKDEKTQKPLEGVEYTLYGELDNGKTITYTAKTDKNGEILFGAKEGAGVLAPGRYTITETAADGHTLLKDPVEVTLPLKLTKAEADAKGADITEAKWDENEEVYKFFDLSYVISNDTTLELPQTGNNNLLYGILAGAGIAVLTGLYFGLKKRKERLLAE